MYIEEIILEGFKSYATRTVIPAWDPQFNAITGLNGSGKSNILDAICFVLGIDNLRQVRATSMQDLIYKRGQSGITKASVTLVFNNTDPSQSPIGYADHAQITVTRQIVVGGKNKYLVNGHNSTNKAVENLFQSVQLNVNNPHFLIMQGQITKVLNMKPPEILALIEETAGTRMFEDRREKALSTIEKKEKKMEEMEGVLKEIIEPKLEILRMERTQFLEYKKAEADIDNLRKVLIAFDFFTKGQAVERIHEQIIGLEASHESFGQEETNLKEQAKSLEKKVTQLKKEKAAEAEGDKIKRFEDAVRDAANVTTRLETQIELQRNQLATAQKDSEKLVKSARREEKGQLEMEKRLLELQSKLETFRVEHDAVAGQVKQTEELLQSLETGVSISEDGQAETGYARLLRELRSKLSECNRCIRDSEIKISEIEEELASINPQVAKASKDSQNTIQKLSDLRTEISTLSAEIGRHSESSDGVESKMRLEVLIRKQKELEKSAGELRETIDRCKSKVAHVSFSYSDPSPNFDRDKVKGLVAELVRLDKSVAERYGNALEVAAGGRLYNVVVENDSVASHLLDRGRLKKRVTIIPLNRIVPKVIGSDKIRRAQQLAPGRVHSALELVGSVDEVEEAIRYVFGGTLVCDDSEAANLVAFDNSVSSRAVTIDGDIYEPSGTLTGGSRQSSGSAVLETLSKYRIAQEDLLAVEAELKQLNGEVSLLHSSNEALASKSEKLSLLEHEAAMLQRQFEQNAQGKLIARKERLDSELVELRKILQEKTEEKRSLEGSIKQAKKESDDFSSNRTEKLKSLSASLERAKSTLLKETERMNGAEREYESGEAELASLKDRMEKTLKAITEAEERKKECEGEIQSLELSYEEGKALLTKAESELEGQVQQLLRFDTEISRADSEKIAAQEQAEKLSMLRSKISNDLEKLREEGERCMIKMKEELKQHQWLIDSQKHFGVKGGLFDFESLKVEAERERLRVLEDRQRVLKRNINTNVLDMIDRVEAREASVKSMLLTVNNDKKMISTTIDALDDFKREALERTWARVNEDFGAIFNDLLPGNSCRLEPLGEGGVITSQGLEIKVKLGGVWKESLTELSGGQRSLTALALILALLQYKPAPMYILDEVDAALDLSHTQNIGTLLKKRFKGSQFIVVSLKEGMFTNANVLFRTRFRDGVSSIERIQQKHQSDHHEQQQQNQNINTNTNTSVKYSNGTKLKSSSTSSKSNPLTNKIL